MRIWMPRAGKALPVVDSEKPLPVTLLGVHTKRARRGRKNDCLYDHMIMERLGALDVRTVKGYLYVLMPGADHALRYVVGAHENRVRESFDDVGVAHVDQCLTFRPPHGRKKLGAVRTSRKRSGSGPTLERVVGPPTGRNMNGGFARMVKRPE